MTLHGRDPGALRESITIQEASQATDAGGGRGTASWASITTTPTVMASVQPVASQKRLDAAQAGAPIDFEVIIHHRTDVDSRNRFLWGSRALRIVSGPVNRDQRTRYLWFECVEDTD